MNVIICGAGEVGTHAAEVLGDAGHDITVVDNAPAKLAAIEETLDVRILEGNCANADVLIEAGADDPEGALVAATSFDETNLLTCAVARGLGIGKTIARVHHSAYFRKRGLDYESHLGITRLICPEFSASQEIASTLRNPASLYIESFGEGHIEMQEFRVTRGAAAVDKALIDLGLPRGVRVAAVKQGDQVSLPVATTVFKEGDRVILVGNVEVFQEGRKLFQRTRSGQQRIVLAGGSATAVWLCRALQDRSLNLRLFEADRKRAEDLAEKLDWVTVVHGDATDLALFEEERIGEADAYIGLDDDDEHNILGCAWAKAAGVKQTVAVVQKPRYLGLLKRIGIDHAFSPRRVAVRQIARTFEIKRMLQIATLAEGVIDCYRIRVDPTADAVGKPLSKIKLSPDWMIAAIHHGDRTYVPGADDFIHAEDIVVCIGKHGAERRLTALFAG